MRSLPNTVLPTKIYGVWKDGRQVGRINSDTSSGAFEKAKKKHGACAVILEGATQKEPMFQ